MVQRSECRHQLQYPPDRHSLPYSSYVDPLLYPPPMQTQMAQTRSLHASSPVASRHRKLNNEGGNTSSNDGGRSCSGGNARVCGTCLTVGPCKMMVMKYCACGNRGVAHQAREIHGRKQPQHGSSQYAPPGRSPSNCWVDWLAPTPETAARHGVHNQVTLHSVNNTVLQFSGPFLLN